MPFNISFWERCIFKEHVIPYFRGEISWPKSEDKQTKRLNILITTALKINNTNINQSGNNVKNKMLLKKKVKSESGRSFNVLVKTRIRIKLNII